MKYPIGTKVRHKVGNVGIVVGECDYLKGLALMVEEGIIRAPWLESNTEAVDPFFDVKRLVERACE